MVVEEAARAAAAVAAATPEEGGVPITDSTKPEETDFWCLKLSCFFVGLQVAGRRRYRHVNGGGGRIG